MPASSEARKPKRRRNRPRRKSDPQGPAKSAAAAIKALARSGPALGDKGADDPLTAEEVTRMKEHFRFLRAHKKLLKLRLNAAEDLLLNGVREPSHRGVCQHLLSKVEKDRVLAVSERMPASEAAKLLASVMAFAPEVAYVLRYLECVSDARSKPEAASALAHALRRIDFSETSPAQMRQILQLIVSVFSRAELPLLVFSWLSNPAFRRAFDRSSDVLPEELGRLVLPLRAAHLELSDGADTARIRRPRELELGEAERTAGFELLLSSPKGSLLELPAAVRRRLLHEASSKVMLTQTARAGLLTVFSSLSWRQASDESDAALRLAGAMLAAGDESRAKVLLEHESLAGPQLARAKRWLRFLKAPRLGPIAVDDHNGRGRRRGGAAPDSEAAGSGPSERWQSGFHLPSQNMVRYRIAAPGQQASFAAQLASWQHVLVPSVLRPLAFDLESETPWVAVARVGRSLARARDAAREGAPLRRQAGVELCALLSATARAGVLLPDAALGRFSVDDAGRIWLVDLWGASAVSVEQALAGHAALARQLLEQLFYDIQSPSEDLSLRQLVDLCEATGPSAPFPLS